MAVEMEVDLEAANQRLLARRATSTRQAEKPSNVVPLRPVGQPDLDQALKSLQRSAQSVERARCGRCKGPVSDDDIARWWKRRGFEPTCLTCEAKAATAVALKREANLPNLMRASGVSIVHSTARPGDFPADIQAAMLAAIAPGSTGAMVVGPPGTGKTRFGAACVGQALVRGDSATMALAGQLVRRIWSTYRDESKETEDAVLDSMCSVSLLVIDDLGREGRITDAVKRVIHELLSRRIDNMRPTVVTTNLDLSEIPDVYDASIHSRLASLLPVVIDGPDRRIS